MLINSSFNGWLYTCVKVLEKNVAVGGLCYMAIARVICQRIYVFKWKLRYNELRVTSICINFRSYDLNNHIFSLGIFSVEIAHYLHQIPLSSKNFE